MHISHKVHSVLVTDKAEIILTSWYWR